MPHDLEAFASNLSAKLSTRSRHICVFLGAGSSRAAGLPDVAALQKAVVEALTGAAKAYVQKQLEHRNLEQLLSRIRRIAALVEGEDLVDGMTMREAANLDQEICHIIVKCLTATKVDLSAASKFAAWASRSDYLRPIEVFTVNYDLVLEEALEAIHAAYFDGFTGVLRGYFRSDLVESSGAQDADSIPRDFVRLWKLHGSVNWAWETSTHSEVVRRGAPVEVGELAAIYPSDTKYEESRRVPFVVLQDRFRRALRDPETLTLVCGYSWSDGHLNELLFEAAARRPRSETLAFCYGDLPEEVATRAATLPNLQVLGAREAIIGGERAPWVVPEGTELSGEVFIDGESVLGNFAHLASFLFTSTASSNDWHQDSFSSPVKF